MAVDASKAKGSLPSPRAVSLITPEKQRILRAPASFEAVRRRILYNLQPVRRSRQKTSREFNSERPHAFAPSRPQRVNCRERGCELISKAGQLNGDGEVISVSRD